MMDELRKLNANELGNKALELRKKLQLCVVKKPLERFLIRRLRDNCEES
jgi:hypothetical protein